MASIDVIIEEGLIENAREVGQFFKSELELFDYSFIKEVRGRGMMNAMEYFLVINIT